MPFRRTTGIVSNLPSSDPKTEADVDHIAGDHRASRDAARTYLTSNKGTTVAATLILDAVSMHESETDRINRTLR
jgi:hypothetical protein